MRLLLCLLVGVVVCACCRIGWVSDLLGGAGVSAVGTTLPQSLGWNEGKARNATLGKQYKSGLSSVGAALSALVFGLWLCGLWLCICWESAALTGLNKCVSMTNPGLAPWALQEYRPFRALCRIGLIPYLSFAVLIIILCRWLRLLSDWLGGVVICVCCCVCWLVPLVTLAVGLVVWC